MEAARSLISPSPPPPHLSRAHLRNPLPSSSVPVLHGQPSRAVAFTPTTSTVRHFPASVILQEHRDELRPYGREDKTAQVTLDRRRMEIEAPFCEENENYDFDRYVKYFEQGLPYRLGFLYPLPSRYAEEKPLSSMPLESIVTNTIVVSELKESPLKSGSDPVTPSDVLALAKKAMLASQEAASLAENSLFLASDPDDFHHPGLGPKDSAKEYLIKGQETVRSRRLLERRSKKRRLPKKPNVAVDDVSSSIVTEKSRKIDKGLDLNDPLRLFLWGPETRQLLTVKEEKDLFNNIQDLMRLEEVKQRLQLQFGREPALAEWAQAVGMSCRVLQSCLYSGNRSREKMIYANFRLVVHVAKQYQGKGLNIQDLLQEGSRGLMKSLEKFKPKAGCRFPTYAYWWIRQSIRRAIFQNSRTIRLPENVFALLKKIKNTRNLYIQEGHIPTNEELAKRLGITVERLARLLSSTRNPLSIQDRAWFDQDVTFQEITADPEVEIPNLSVAKQMMRQHMHYLLSILPPREKQIIRFRFGIHGGRPKSLSEIGAVFGLSKERVRQLESRALDRLKGSLSSHGLEAYTDLLI